MKVALFVCLIAAACSSKPPTATAPTNASAETGSAAVAEPTPCTQAQMTELQCEEIVGPVADCYIVDPNAANTEQITAKLRNGRTCSPHGGIAGAWCCNPK